MRNKIILENYVGGKIRIEGYSILEGLEVLAWVQPNGQRIVHLDEVGKIYTRPIVGRICLRYADIASKCPSTAKRSLFTNHPDVAQACALWPHGLIPNADQVWLGVRVCRNATEDSEDVGLPQWAWGHEVIEANPPFGYAFPLGYCKDAQDLKRFKVAEDFYVALHVADEYGRLPGGELLDTSLI